MNNDKLLRKQGAFPCAMRAWQQYEQSLAIWLIKKTQDTQLSQDILQDVFVKLMEQKVSFCEISNAKAWMFRVANNLLIDISRKQRIQLTDVDIEDEEPINEAIDLLAMSCLPRVLSELAPSDRAIIQACDIDGMGQQEFANCHQLTLSATKSRLRRAREKLKKNIQRSCQVKLDENQNVCCFVARDPIENSD